MKRTILPRLFLALVTLVSAVGTLGCDEEDPEPPVIGQPIPSPGPAPTPVPTIGNDPAVITACQSACDGQADATSCDRDAKLAEQVAGCKTRCAEQVASVPKSCTEDAIAAYECAEVAPWSCFGSQQPQLAENLCDDEMAAYRDCIIAGK